MLFDNNEKLEEKIVYALGKHPSQGAEALMQSVGAPGQHYSIQAIYKELKKLEQQGVVVKIKRTYSLRLPWITYLARFVEEIEANYAHEPILKTLLPKQGGRQTWQFTNLIKLNNFWAQLLLLLLKQSPSKILYDYAPHPWYHLAQTEAEDQFIKSFEMAQGKIIIALGNKNYLDTWATQFWNSPRVEYAFVPKNFSNNPETEINCIDDYILTVKLSPQTYKAIDTLYKRTTSLDDKNMSHIIYMFNSPQRAKITLELNKQKALQVKRKFARFFGITR